MALPWLSRVASLHSPSKSLVASLRSSKRDGLCSVCSKLDFREVFEASITYPLKWSQRISLGHIERHPECPFCRLVLKTLQEVKSREEIVNDLTDESGRIWLERGREETWTRIGSEANAKDGLTVPYISMQDKSNYKHCIHCLEDRLLGVSQEETLLRGRQVNEIADFAMLKKWLLECERSHGSRCRAVATGELNPQGHFRVIDVVDRRVLPAFGRNLKYFALSYVWGTFDVPQLTLRDSTSRRLFTKGGLEIGFGDIPTTLEDAMKLTELLGYRYLWIDALCIFQDSATDQAMQIDKMHHIYEHSDLTIVCAAGSDSWSGLPGISSRGKLQHIETVQGLRLANVLLDFERAIEKSVWLTRAWTMQEMYFSNRLMFFTKEQIYFKCENSLWREDKVLEAESLIAISAPTNALGTYSKSFLQKATRSPRAAQVDAPAPDDNKHTRLWSSELVHDFYIQDQFWQYSENIHRYVQRKLSNPTDILNAFMGVMKSYSEVMDCEYFCGLPTACFLHGLAFSSANGPCRRTGFPSWSWAGWQSKSQSTNHSLSHNFPQYIVYSNWHGSTVATNLSTTVNFYRLQYKDFWTLAMINTAKSIWRLDHNGYARRIPVGLPESFDVNAELVEALTPWQKSNLLVFQARSAFMPVQLKEYTNSSCTWIMSSLSPYTGSFVSIGTMPCVPNEPGSLPQLMEFVFLGDYDHENQDKYVIAMAIKTDDRGVSERVDVTSPIAVRDWEAFQPVVRTVYLV